MAYFDGVKIGDRVWDFRYEWGTVTKVHLEGSYPIIVNFDNLVYKKSYTYDGRYSKTENQTLFWDEIKFEIPKKPIIKLKETQYIIGVLNEEQYINTSNKNFSDDYYNTSAVNYGLTRNDKETAKKALKQIKKYTKLLALRDQECPDSRGYKITYNKDNKTFEQFYTISKNLFESKFFVKWCCEAEDVDIFTIPFKTEEDAQKICDILNSNKFNLEGE